MRLIQMIRNDIRHSRVTKLYERMENAVRNKAKLQSDSIYHTEMAHFYTDRVEAINPHADWWGFAAVKQKQVDSYREIQSLEERINEANAAIKASKEAYEAMRDAVASAK